jgi:hypothetical protein
MPDFSEPASGRLDVPLSRVEDVALAVLGIVPGNTRLNIDGRTRGSLDASDPVGSLSADTLTLRLRGAMVAGVHTMVLANSGGEEPLDSRTIEVHLAPVASPPVLVAEMVGEPVLGTGVLAAGAADRSVLAILDDTIAEAPVLVVAPRAWAGWDLEAARRVSIPGYRRGPEETGLAIAVQRTAAGDDPEDDRLRVAWRVGMPGTAIDLLEEAWTSADETTIGVRAFDLDPAVLGAYEHAELDRPALVGDTLVAEALAATDIEAPRPGDRTLLHARLSGAPVAIGGAARIVLGDRLDLDAIGPVLDPASVEVGGAPLLGARLDGRTPIVLEADPVHGRLSARPTITDGTSRALAGVEGPLASVVGAFGSRSVAGLFAGDPGRVRLVEIDDWGPGGTREHSLGPDALPDPQTATGDLAVGLVAGTAVWLVPYGADVPVHAVIGGGEEPVVQRIDALHCATIAVGFDPRDPGAPLHLACATGGGEITRALLRAETG